MDHLWKAQAPQPAWGTQNSRSRTGTAVGSGCASPGPCMIHLPYRLMAVTGIDGLTGGGDGALEISRPPKTRVEIS